ncbi:MAG TPA: DUF4097 family beta strand repeat-containing protein [Vicinamibacteria bacterium]|nr:DUF4097 family beta strand repeat-containing protein [Vicinamibacteria bacterium]
MAGLAMVALAATPARADEWSHQYPLKGRPDLHVKTDDGSVRIETGAASEVGARVTTSGWRIGPGDVTITESQSGDRVDIEVRIPNRHFSMGHHSVTLALRVPKEADLDVHTGDGGIEVQPVSGRVSLSTGDGSITADGLQGEIHLRSGDGSIRATGLSGRLAAETGDGHMDVRGRFDVLTLHTGDGGIEAAAEAGSKVEAAWSLHSGDGSITLRLPDGLGADLDAHTGDGSIALDKPVTVSGTINRNAVRGKLGPGGPPLKVETGDGSIRLLGL